MLSHLISYIRKLFLSKKIVENSTIVENTTGGYSYAFTIAIVGGEKEWFIFLAQNTKKKVDIYSYPTEREARINYTQFLTTRKATLNRWTDEGKKLGGLEGKKL